MCLNLKIGIHFIVMRTLFAFFVNSNASHLFLKNYFTVVFDWLFGTRFNVYNQNMVGWINLLVETIKLVLTLYVCLRIAFSLAQTVIGSVFVLTFLWFSYEIMSIWNEVNVFFCCDFSTKGH